jgi:hypothetical protein
MSEPTMVERLARRWNERLTQDFEIPVVQPMPGWYANDARWWLRAIAEEMLDAWSRGEAECYDANLAAYWLNDEADR